MVVHEYLWHPMGKFGVKCGYLEEGDKRIERKEPVVGSPLDKIEK